MKSKALYFFYSVITSIVLFLVEILFIDFIYSILQLSTIAQLLTYLLCLIVINPMICYRFMEYAVEKKWIEM